MADRIKGITVEINGDTTKLQSALKAVNGSLRESKTALNDVNKLLKMDPGNVTLLKQKQELLTKSIDDTKSKLDQEKEALRQLGTVDQTDEVVKQQQALEREIADTEQQLKSLEREYKNFGSVAAQQTQAAGNKLKDIGGNMAQVGSDLTKNVTMPIVGLGAAAVKVGMDFDTAMSSVKAKTKASDEEFKQLRDTAREWGANTRFSATEVANAMDYMAMAGWNTEQIMAGVGDVLALAAAGGEDLATTSDIVTDGLTAFGLGAEDAKRFADVMAATATAANTDVGMMGESFKYAGSLAGSFGYSIEDVSVALGLMANRGTKASQAGTAIRGLITRMSKQPKEAKAAMDALNLSLTDLSTGSSKSLMTVMTDLREAFKGVKLDSEGLSEGIADVNAQLEAGEISEKDAEKEMDRLLKRYVEAEDVSKAMYAAQLAGTAGLPGLLAIINATDEEFQNLTESIYNSDGAAKEMMETMDDNMGGDFAKFVSALSDLAISVSDILAPVIRDLTTFLTDLTNKLNSMDEGTKKSIVAFLAVVAAIGPVLLVIGKLIAGIGQVIFWFGKIQAAWPAIVAAFGAIKAAAITVVSAIGGPLTLAIIGLIGSIAFMIAKIKECGMTWEDFVDGMVFLWNDAVAFVKQLVEDIIYVYDDLTGKAFHWGIDLIKNFVEGILSKVPVLRNAVNKIADEIASRIHFSSPDVGPLADFPRYMPDMLKELSEGINKNIGMLDKPMNNLASAMVPTNGMGDKLDGIKGAIGNMNTNVNVTLEGDAQGLFRMVKTQNGKAKRMTGRSAFA